MNPDYLSLNFLELSEPLASAPCSHRDTAGIEGLTPAEAMEDPEHQVVQVTSWKKRDRDGGWEEFDSEESKGP